MVTHNNGTQEIINKKYINSKFTSLQYYCFVSFKEKIAPKFIKLFHDPQMPRQS